MTHYVYARQQWLVSAQHAALAQSKTVLVSGIPRSFLTEAALSKICDFVPGGVRRIWIPKDLKDLPEYYDRRLKACKKLEGAETKVCKVATKLENKRLKAVKKGKKDVPPRPGGDEWDGEKNVTIDDWVPKKKRPTHRLFPIPLPFAGKKVDTIHWAREEIETCNKEVDTRRGADFQPLGSAFIQFNNQVAAHMFAQ